MEKFYGAKKAGYDFVKDIRNTIHTVADSAGSKQKKVYNFNSISSEEKKLISLGEYYGENNLLLPEEYSNDQWVCKGYEIGKRRTYANDLANNIDSTNRKGR